MRRPGATPGTVLGVLVLGLTLSMGGEASSHGLTIREEVDGGSHRSFPIEVPPNATRLRIDAAWSIAGGLEVTLRDPSGHVAHSSQHGGFVERPRSRWHEHERPAPGTWRLEVSAGGRGTYEFWHDHSPEATARPGRLDVRAVGLGLAAAAVVAGGLWASETSRIGLVRAWLAFGLYSRLARHELLSHERREAVTQYVRANPGRSFSDLRRDLVIGNGALVHHLRLLERQGFVHSEMDGFRRRYYPPGGGKGDPAYLTLAQRQVLATIEAQPWSSQRDVVAALGWPRKTVAYHLGRLEALGQIEAHREGREVRYARTAADVAKVSPTST